jgi:hypothetical protein
MTQLITPPFHYVNCYYPDGEKIYHRGCVLFSRLLNLFPFPDNLSETEIPHELEIAGMKPDLAWISSGIHHKSLRPVYRTHYWFDDGKILIKDASDLSDKISCQVIISTLDNSEVYADDAMEELNNTQHVCYTSLGPYQTFSEEQGSAKNLSPPQNLVTLFEFAHQSLPSSTDSRSYMIDMDHRLHHIASSVPGFRTHLVSNLPPVHDIAFSSTPAGTPLTFLVDNQGHIHIVFGSSLEDLSSGYSMNQDFTAVSFETVPVDDGIPYELVGVAIDTIGFLHALTQNSTGLYWMPIALLSNDHLQSSLMTFVSIVLLPASLPSMTQKKREIRMIGFALTRTGTLYSLRPPDNTADCHDSLVGETDHSTHLCWRAVSYPCHDRSLMLWNMFCPTVQDSLGLRDVAHNFLYGIADEGKLMFSNTLQETWNEIAPDVKFALSFVRWEQTILIHEVLYLDTRGSLNCLSFRERTRLGDGTLTPEVRMNQTLSVEQGRRLFLMTIENISHVLMTTPDETSSIMFRERDENEDCSWENIQSARSLFSYAKTETLQSEEEEEEEDQVNEEGASEPSQYSHNVSTSLRSNVQVIGTKTNLPVIDHGGYNVISYDARVL